MTTPAIFELIDNDEYGLHGDARRWLAAYYGGALSVATGYISLDGSRAQHAYQHLFRNRQFVGKEKDPVRSGVP